MDMNENAVPQKKRELEGYNDTAPRLFWAEWANVEQDQDRTDALTGYAMAVAQNVLWAALHWEDVTRVINFSALEENESEAIKRIDAVDQIMRSVKTAATKALSIIEGNV